MTETRKQYVEKSIKMGKFYRNKDSVVVSREYPNKEMTSEAEDKIYNKNHKDKPRKYYGITNKLCKKYYPNPSCVLEVGSGSGYFAKKYINCLKPKKYVACDFCKMAILRMKKRIKMTENTKIQIKYKNINDIRKIDLEKFDCVIALEVLEHVTKDLKFLSKINKGTWVFLSVPRIYGYNHVRAFLTPDSICYRYRKLLNIYEIREDKRNINFKSRHNYPLIWIAVGQKI